MKKSYQYRLYPSEKIKQVLNQTSNELRKLYDHFLKEYKELDKTINEFSLKEQRQEWNKLRDKQVKDLVAIKKQNPQLNNICSQVLQDLPYREIPSFWKSFLIKRERYKRLNKKFTYPRFKTEKGWYSRITYPQKIVNGYWMFTIEKGQLLIKQGNGIDKQERVLEIDVVLHSQRIRPLPIDKVKTLTITWKNDEYYANFSCEVEEQPLPKTGKIVGGDVGITSFVALDNGKLYDEERKHYLKAEKGIIKWQRIFSRRTKESKGREEARLILAKKWKSFTNQRKHETHQVVNDLVRDFDIIVHENLKIENLVRNHCLAKRIQNASWGIFFTILFYKAKGAGRKVVKVSPYNTSQICSECDELREPRLKLGQKIFNCFSCGLKMNRDVNAAKNILNKYLAERCGTNLWGAVPVGAVENHEFSTEKPTLL